MSKAQLWFDKVTRRGHKARKSQVYWQSGTSARQRPLPNEKNPRGRGTLMPSIREALESAKQCKAGGRDIPLDALEAAFRTPEPNAAAATPADLVSLVHIAAYNRRNTLAHDAYVAAKALLPLPRLVTEHSIQLDRLLYAICREPDQLERALALWDEMAAAAVTPKLEPLEKLLSCCVARQRLDDGFRIFLAAIDANLQPSATLCTKLVRATCDSRPDLAQMAYAVVISMKGSGMALPPDVSRNLACACAATGAIDQALDLHEASLGPAGADGSSCATDGAGGFGWEEVSASTLALACGDQGGPPRLARGIALLSGLRGAGLSGSAEAYAALLRAACRAALARGHPTIARDAHTLWQHMCAEGHFAEPPMLNQLLLACGRTRLRDAALEVFDAVMANGVGAADHAALRALILCLDGSGVSSKPIGAERADWLIGVLGVLGGASGLDAGQGDKQLAHALLRMACADGLRQEAARILRIMCESSLPALAPSPKLLAVFLATCSTSAQGVKLGVFAYDALSRHPQLAPGVCGELWATLVDAAARSSKPTVGLQIYKSLTADKVEVSNESATTLYEALVDAKRDDEAFELQALLTQRGIVVSGGGGRLASGDRGSTAATAEISADVSASNPAAAVDVSNLESAADGGGGSLDAPRIATLQRLFDEAIEQSKWDGALEMLRQLGEAGSAPSEERLAALARGLFSAGQPRHANAVLQHAREGGCATASLARLVIDGLLEADNKECTALALSLYEDQRAADEILTAQLLARLQRAAINSKMLDDAAAIRAHAHECHQGHKSLRRMDNAQLGAWLQDNKVRQAFHIFCEMDEASSIPPGALCAKLVEQLCESVMGPRACRVLLAVTEELDEGAPSPLEPRHYVGVVIALLRGKLPREAFNVFAKYLEPETSAVREALISKGVGESRAEHALAMLTRALATELDGRRAHRAFSFARSSNLVQNYSSFGLPSLLLACVESSMIDEAASLTRIARDALLPIDMVTASALLVACCRSQLTHHVAELVRETHARRLGFDKAALQLAAELLLSQKPPLLEESALTVEALGSAIKASGGGSGDLARLTRLQEKLVLALCAHTKEERALETLRRGNAHGILPTAPALQSLAEACGRRRASALLSELVELLLKLQPRLPPDVFSAATAACADAGADVNAIGQATREVQKDGGYVAPAARGDAVATPHSTGPGAARGRLSIGAGDAKKERAALEAAQAGPLKEERNQLRSQCTQMRLLLHRRTRIVEWLRQEVPGVAKALARRNAKEAELAHAGDAGDADSGSDAEEDCVAGAAPVYGEGFSELDELRTRYDEMATISHERHKSLSKAQERCAELEAYVASLRSQLRQANIDEEASGQLSSRLGGSQRAKRLELECFSEVSSKSWYRPEGWPKELLYTNQLLWDEVPEDLHFFRHRLADPATVRRPFRTQIRKITNKKHPCCGFYGLYAAEDIPAGQILFDYAGQIRVFEGDEKDQSSSSYLLNLYTHEEANVFIDIDASRAGNEARFLNDFRGTGPKPNAQFWPMYDAVSGDKRMAVKTIAAIETGLEILVDYGGRYFEKLSDEDSDMEDDDEYMQKPTTKKRRRD